MRLAAQFRREAEELAEEVRADLGIGNLAALDPIALLDHLEVPAISLTRLLTLDSGRDPDLGKSIDFLLSEESASLSAVTVFGRGGNRMVVFNDANSVARRNSDLCHEASHALLLHPPSVTFDAIGCRTWDAQIEDEAQHLAGALLVPGKAARYAAKAGWSREVVAERFGCSRQMATWRDNIAGGKRLRGRALQ